MGRGWMVGRTQGNARETSSTTTSQRCWQAGAKTALERVQGFPPSLSWASHAPGGQSAPPPCVVTETEHGNPVRLPQGKASRKASRKACGKRRMEAANAILSWDGEGLSPWATSLHAKAR